VTKEELEVLAEEVAVRVRGPGRATAEPRRVSPAVTEAVTTGNTLVVGSAPAMATATLLVSASSALATTAISAAELQHGATTMHHASTVAAVDILLGVSARKQLRKRLSAALKRG
jgi:hypothetical protein